MGDLPKVLVTGPSLSDPGGVANYYRAVLPWLNRSKNFEIKYLEIGSGVDGNRLLRRVRDQLLFRRVLKESAPQIVHVNPSLNPKSFLRDAAFVYQCHRSHSDSLVFFRGWSDRFAELISNSKILRFLFARTFGRAQQILALGTPALNGIVDWSPHVPARLETTVVDDSLIEGFRPDARSMDEKTSIKLLLLARLEKEKGVFDVLEALELLLKNGYKFTLTIAGSGSAVPQILAKVEKSDLLSNHVSLSGYVRGKEKRDLLATHHIFCFPSYHAEGMPNAMLEAMSFGMPIIACPVGAIPDIFTECKAGVLVPPKSPKDIASAIRALSTPEAISEVGFTNHSYAITHFLASQAADRLLRSYSAILESKKI